MRLGGGHVAILLLLLLSDHDVMMKADADSLSVTRSLTLSSIE